MNVIPILCRLGNVDMSEWLLLTSITTDTIMYKLYTAAGRITTEARRYMVELVVDDIVVRRGKLGVLQTNVMGVSYEFNKSVNPSSDPVYHWFSSLRNHYYGAGDDWIIIAFSIGEAFYTRDIERGAATAFEREQQNILFKVQNDFTLNFTGLTMTKPDDYEEETKLDDIWNVWSDDNDDLQDP